MINHLTTFILSSLAMILIFMLVGTIFAFPAVHFLPGIGLILLLNATLWFLRLGWFRK